MKSIFTILFAFLTLTQLLSQNTFIVNGSLGIVTTGPINIVLNDYNYLNQTGSILNTGGYWNFIGSTNQTITGTSQFENITINKSNNEVLLIDDISVSGYATMTSGNMNLNGKILDLGTTGLLIGETNTRKIYSTLSSSYVRSMRTIGSGVTINPGNIGLSLVTTNALGITEVRRRNEIVDVGTSNMSINRVYSVFPSTNNGNLNATLDINYFNSELNGLDENYLVTFRRPSTNSLWINKGGSNIQTSIGSGTGIIQNLNWMEFSEVTLALNAIPLPIELTKFEVNCVNYKTLLNWTTATELNSDYFTIERSSDGFNFEKIAIIDAFGTTINKHNYDYMDLNPLGGISYYRLKQTDYDGKSKTYKIESISCGDKTSEYVIYPNPNTGVFEVMGTEVGEYLLIIDMIGKVIYSIESTSKQTKIDLSSLSKGVYYLSINKNESIITKKIIIE